MGRGAIGHPVMSDATTDRCGAGAQRGVGWDVGAGVGVGGSGGTPKVAAPRIVA